MLSCRFQCFLCIWNSFHLLRRAWNKRLNSSHSQTHLDNGKLLFARPPLFIFLIWPFLNWLCASQMHLCITNGWRPAQLNKALSGNRMTLSLVNISESLNNADCHLLLILPSSLLHLFSLPIFLRSVRPYSFLLPIHLSFYAPIIFNLLLKSPWHQRLPRSRSDALFSPLHT